MFYLKLQNGKAFKYTNQILYYHSRITGIFKEYERAVIFRLGRLLSGGARGPGVFFIIPCVDIYEKIDMRTQTFDVPPQEVNLSTQYISLALTAGES